MKWALVVLLAASCRTPPLVIDGTVDMAVVDAAGGCPPVDPPPHTACDTDMQCAYSHEQICNKFDCVDGVWLLAADHCIGGI